MFRTIGIVKSFAGFVQTWSPPGALKGDLM